MPPPLPPRELGFRLSRFATTNLDVFIDLACPFSKKIFLQLAAVHKWADTIKKDAFSVRFLLTPQPWHPQSPILAEAVLAMQMIDESKTVDYTTR